MSIETAITEYVEGEYGRPYEDADLRIWCRLHGWRYVGRDEDYRPTYKRGDIVGKAFVWQNATQIRQYLMAWMEVLKKS